MGSNLESQYHGTRNRRIKLSQQCNSCGLISVMTTHSVEVALECAAKGCGQLHHAVVTSNWSTQQHTSQTKGKDVPYFVAAARPHTQAITLRLAVVRFRSLSRHEKNAEKAITLKRRTSDISRDQPTTHGSGIMMSQSFSS